MNSNLNEEDFKTLMDYAFERIYTAYCETSKKHTFIAIEIVLISLSILTAFNRLSINNALILVILGLLILTINLLILRKKCLKRFDYFLNLGVYIKETTPLITIEGIIQKLESLKVL